MRYTGKLKKWNTERGFGFILADDGGQDIFVHVTSFPRDGRLPTEGEVLSFEVEPDRNGKRSAVRVHRAGSTAPQMQTASLRLARSPNRNSGSSHFAKALIGVLLVVGLGLFAYSRYLRQVAPIQLPVPAYVEEPTPAPLPVPLPVHSPAVVPAPVFAKDPLPQPIPVPKAVQSSAQNFQCDGRKHCSQMTSCGEAKFFLRNCPDVRMDGNHDGIPCEQQWCTSSFSQ